MWCDQEKHDIRSVYHFNNKNYGIRQDRPRQGEQTNIRDWFACREEFHYQNRHISVFYYAHDLPNPSRGRAISVFFDKFEDQLGLPPEDRARFGPTSKRRVIWVRPGKWWWGHSMRRSLFTALLRSASNYRIHLNNFDQALYGTAYIGTTREAVKWFLKGNTFYWGKSRGWQEAFYGCTNEEVKPLLREKSIPRKGTPRPAQAQKYAELRAARDRVSTERVREAMRQVTVNAEETTKSDVRSRE